MVSPAPSFLLRDLRSRCGASRPPPHPLRATTGASPVVSTTQLKPTATYETRYSQVTYLLGKGEQMSEIAVIETGTGSKTQARCSHVDEAGHCRRRTRYVYRAPTGLEVPVCAHHRPDTTDLTAAPPDRLPLRLHLGRHPTLRRVPHRRRTVPLSHPLRIRLAHQDQDPLRQPPPEKMETPMTDLPLDSVVYLECILVDKASSAFPAMQSCVRSAHVPASSSSSTSTRPALFIARRLRTWLGYFVADLGL